MKTIKNDEGTFIFPISEKELKNWKILILAIVILYLLFNILNFVKNEFNYIMFIFQTIIILILVLLYYVSKKK